MMRRASKVNASSMMAECDDVDEEIVWESSRRLRSREIARLVTCHDR
jgi:hypothetical protein